MDLQQNLSSLEVNFKNQKSIIDALSDNHIQCNEIKQELETTITQKVNSLNMDQQFTDLISTTQGLEEKVTKTTNNNTTLETRMKNLEKLQIFISDSFGTVEENMAEITSKVNTTQSNIQKLEVKVASDDKRFKKLEQNIQQEMQTAEGDRHKIKQKVTETNNNISKIKKHHDNFEVILRKLSVKIGRIMCLFYQVSDPKYVMEDGEPIHTLQDFLWGELADWRMDFHQFDDYIQFKHLPPTSFTK